MKLFSRLFLIFAACGAVAACARTSDIDGLQKQIDELKSDRIQTISGQISAIQTSITSLKSTDEELQGYISALMTEADKLEAADKALEESIAKLREDLQGIIGSAEADALYKLENLKAIVETELATLKAAIEELQKKDAELKERIDSLQTYIDSRLKDTKDWASATFATLDQYNATAAIVATIQTQIASINSEISGMKTAMATQKADLDKSIADLDANLRAEIKSAADAAAKALEAATDEITKAYTAAIAGAISACESSIKSWVNEQLTGYYTIAQIDSRFDVLLTTLEAKIDATTEGLADALQDILLLKTALADQKTEITAAYTQAIADAITANNGTLDAKLKAEIKTINDLVHTIKLHANEAEKLALILKQEVQEIKDGLKALSSIAYIPKYADGIERVEYEVSGYKFTKKGDLTLRFDIYPASSAQIIADNYSKALSARVVYTIPTRANAGDFKDLQITGASATGGILTVTVSSSELDFDFLVGNLKASLVLKVTTGYNNLQSAYIPLVASGENLSYAQYVLGSFDTDRDEDLSEAELSAVTDLDLTRCPDINTLDLTIFPNLDKVNCPSLDWLRKLAPTYDITTTFLSADGRSRLYPEDDILIDGTVWQTKNVGTITFDEMGTEVRYETARDSSCPEGYRLPTRDEFEALSRNHMLFHAPSYFDGFRFSGSRAWTIGSRVPSIVLPFSRHGELKFGTYYWIYSTDIPATDIPTFYLDDMPPDQRTPSGWFREHPHYSSERTGIRCVKD